MSIFKHKRLQYIQVIAIGFAAIILLGSFLLTLPIASRTGTVTDFSSALFTATSATCVTGLIVVDTFQHWTVFGQVVILILIQIGGLGFMTVATMFSLFIRRRIGLKERGVLQESVNTNQVGGIVRLTKKILIGTVIFEGTGAILLATRFCPEMGLKTGIYYSIFHSVSAFCNAGFDLMGRFSAFSSLTRYYDDLIVNVVIMLLIIIGGIGFVVWNDISINKFSFRKYQLHTKIVLIATATLIFGGAFLYFLFESQNLFVGMSFQGKVLSSFFQSVTPRTAGFNTIDIAGMTDSSKFLMMILMFIGGSPGSTAGGIKTTTMVVLLLAMRSVFFNTHDCNILKRRIEDSVIKKSVAVFVLNMSLIVFVTMVICSTQGLSLTDVLLEVFSAMGTVGVSTGITSELTLLSRMLVCGLMYTGRVGSLSFAISFTSHKTPTVQLPEAKVSIG